MARKITAQEIEDIYKLHIVLHQVNDINHMHREKELIKYAITPEQSSTLICIYCLGEKATPAELSRWMAREPHSIFIILRRMCKFGLIKMEPHPKNKHMFQVSLTEAGYDAFLNSVKFLAPIQIFTSLSKAERQYLLYLLIKLRNKGIRLRRLKLNDYNKLVRSFKMPNLEGEKEPQTEKRKGKKNLTIK
jgi:DNA-binding MarR family transcriptional regulator